MNDYASRIPVPKGARELNIGDQWRALYVNAEALPEGLPIIHAYAVVFAGDRGYVTREKGASNWAIVDAPVPHGASLNDAISAAVHEQTGVRVDRTEVTGYLDCKATQFNTDFGQGTRAARAFVIAIAADVEDMPEESGRERRRLRLNEFAANVRKQHAELERPLSDAIDRYMVLRARGEA
jgi:ADP-ribose pyrophosphatase YjhB (NUDIX family)